MSTDEPRVEVRSQSVLAIWVTVLLAMGPAVTGKIRRQRAAITEC